MVVKKAKKAAKKPVAKKAAITSLVKKRERPRPGKETQILKKGSRKETGKHG